MSVEVVDDNLSIIVLSCCQSAKYGDKKLADAHSDGAPEQQRTPAPFVEEHETRDGGNYIDARCDHGDGEGVVDSRVEEILRAVVENKVNPWLNVSTKDNRTTRVQTCQLLESLQTHASQLPLEHCSPETVEVAGSAETHLVLMVGLDLLQFILNSRVVLWQPPKSS